MRNQILTAAMLAALALPGLSCAPSASSQSVNEARAIQATTQPKSQPPKQALGLPLYVYETRLSGDPSKMQSYLPAHLDYQIELERKGIMFGAGPLFENDGAGGPPVAGMIIVRADSMDEARAIADADPMHKAGVRTYTIRKWMLNEGALEVSLKFSAQDFELE